MCLVDAYDRHGDEGERIVEVPFRVFLKGHVEIERTASAKHLVESDSKFRMLRDILEVGHRIEPTLGVAETVQFVRDGDIAVFQQLDAGNVCVNVIVSRVLSIQLLCFCLIEIK